MTKIQKKFPRQSKLDNLLHDLHVTYKEAGKAIKMSPAAISLIVTGTNDYKVSVARKFQTYLSKKAGREVLLDDIIE